LLDVQATKVVSINKCSNYLNDIRRKKSILGQVIEALESVIGAFFMLLVN
jgi:hypothetical protein